MNATLAVEGGPKLPVRASDGPGKIRDGYAPAGWRRVLDLEANFSSVALALFEPGTVQGTLPQIADLLGRTVDGCDAAGVLIIDGARPATASKPLMARDRPDLIPSRRGPYR